MRCVAALVPIHGLQVIVQGILQRLQTVIRVFDQAFRAVFFRHLENVVPGSGGYCDQVRRTDGQQFSQVAGSIL